MNQNTSPRESLLKRVGALHQLLDSHFPAHRSKQGHLDIGRMAREMELAHETLYRCVRSNVVKVAVATKLLRFSRTAEGASPLYWEDLLPFVLPDYETFRA